VEIWSGAFSDQMRKAAAACHRVPVINRPALARLGTLWTSSFFVGRREHVDIVHVQGADAPIGDVVTAHCCNAAMRKARESDARLLRRFNSRVGVQAERYCLTKPSTRSVIAVSAKVAREIEHHYQLEPARIQIIPPGVNLQEFHPDLRARWRTAVRSDIGVRQDDFLVLFIGADYKLKGFPTVLEAVARLPRHVRVLAVGVPRRHAIDRSLGSDLRGRVSLLPPTENISRLYAAADCLALPTRYDTFSLVTLEAMASGLPVIVSREAGISEFLNAGIDALLMDRPDDAVGLSRHLESLADDKGRAARIGAAARRTAEQHSWDHVAQRVMNVYRGIGSAA
jgi:UDP-glucose:(heptosyl)LPS alpha-1,3-glucosyltransferase